MIKVAMLLLYCGEGFQGMQRNPGARTIEGALEEALFKSGAIASCGSAKQLGWRRAARTDKGVSAAMQLVSGSLVSWESSTASELVDLVNAHLPDSIRVLCCKLVPHRFCAKAMCDSRRYHFYLPTFAFDPSLHLGRRSSSPNPNASEAPFQIDFHRLNTLLSRFIGCHNFHNFSWHVRADDPSAERTILSFTAAQVEDCAAMAGFVRFVIVGRSFLLHQIRKMIGLVVSVIRGAAPAALIDTALRSGIDVVLPTAPQLGLLLDECTYSDYNASLLPGDEHAMSFHEYRAQIEELKLKIILPHIAAGSAAATTAWLPSLNSRNYAAFLLHK